MALVTARLDGLASLGIPVAVNSSAEVALVSIKGIIVLHNVRHCGNMFSVFDVPLSRR